jgi:hypothetical protein
MEAQAKSIDKADKMHDAPSRSRSTADHLTPTVLSDGFGLTNIQQNAGNIAVQRMFQAGLIQAKLSISQPGDPYEEEADRVADHVMRMPEPTVQRKCAACADGGLCSKCAEQKVQRKASPDHSPEPSSGVSSQIASLRGSGKPLSASTRAFFEPRFGTDFSQIRVHTGGAAADAAHAIQAEAFTTGQDVVFGVGEYAPEGQEGRKLLAHELTHVIQQGGNANVPRTSTLQRQPARAIQKKKMFFLGVDDSEMHSRDYLIAQGLHLVNPVDHYQDGRDTKGRRIRVERWEDRDGNAMWYRVHEGSAHFPVQEADSANNQIAVLVSGLGNDISRLNELRKNGQGHTREYDDALNQAFADESAVWKEIAKAKKMLPGWREEVAGDSGLEKALEEKVQRLDGLEGTMPSLEGMVEELYDNREAQ